MVHMIKQIMGPFSPTMNRKFNHSFSLSFIFQFLFFPFPLDFLSFLSQQHLQTERARENRTNEKRKEREREKQRNAVKRRHKQTEKTKNNTAGERHTKTLRWLAMMNRPVRERQRGKRKHTCRGGKKETKHRMEDKAISMRRTSLDKYFGTLRKAVGLHSTVLLIEAAWLGLQERQQHRHRHTRHSIQWACVQA